MYPEENDKLPMQPTNHSILFINLQKIHRDSLWVSAAAFVFIGIGIGFFLTLNNSAALGALSKDRLGMASPSLTMARLVGQMIETAMVTFYVVIDWRKKNYI